MPYANARILVVDDEPLNCELVRDILAPEGFDFAEARTGVAALQQLEQQEFSLVILDILMPEMDGFELCRRLRQIQALQTLPVIMLTAQADRESKIRGIEVGADDFLSKPVDEIELRARVRNLLRVKAYYDLQEQQKQRLEQEIERSRAQLLQADRLATLGTLAGGIGHELNNVIAVLGISLESIAEAILVSEPNPDLVEDLRNVEWATEHIKRHARQLLKLGRPGPDYAEEISLSEVVEHTLEGLRLMGKTKYCAVTTRLPKGPCPVTINRVRLEQVLINLVGNAADALAQSSPAQPRISIDVQEHNGDTIQCCVQDNAGGVPPDIIERLFEPFFTTKAEGQGTGLGLYVVRNIVEALGGQIEVRNVQDGALFCFAFKRHAQSVPPDQAARV